MGAVAGMVVTLAGVAIWAVARADDLAVNGPTYQRIVLAKDLVADVLPPPEYVIEAYVTALELRDAEPGERVALVARLNQLADDFEARHRYWSDRLDQPGLRAALLDRATAPARRFFALARDHYVPALNRGDRLTVAAVVPALAATYTAHRRAIDDVVAQATAASTAIETDAADALGRTHTRLLAVGVLALALALGGAVALGRRFAAPVHATTRALEQLARGRLDQRLAVAGDVEIARMATAFNGAATYLEATTHGISGTAGRLIDESAHLTGVSRVLTASVAETARRAGEIAAESSDVTDRVERASRSVEELRAGIAAITARAHDAASGATAGVALTRAAEATSRHLRESSAEIDEITCVIAKVAQKTSLLALNATIEAAHAGAAGRGFAIVASEVKELAHATSRATETIRGRVESLQRDIVDVAAAIERVGTTMAQIAAQQEAISSAVVQHTATAGEVGVTLAAAASGTAQIGAAIASVATDARSTADGATRTDRAARALTDMATELHGLVASMGRPGAVVATERGAADSVGRPDPTGGAVALAAIG